MTYTKLLEEKIERLKLEEARLHEKEALKEFAEEERKQKERELRKERMRLEAIKRREEAALKKQIEEKIFGRLMKVRVPIRYEPIKVPVLVPRINDENRKSY